MTGDVAYVVFPAMVRFRHREKEVTQCGAIYTVTLRKSDDGYRVAAWACAKGMALF